MNARRPKLESSDPMNESAVRNAVLGSIDGGQASMTFDEAVANFPPENYNTKPPNVPYSFWHVLEHIRITARDILDYVQNPHYRELTWPDESWPATDATTDAAGWNATIESFRRDMATLRALVAEPDRDLLGVVMNARANQNHTLLRESLVLADHNAYHTGEFAILRQVVGAWPDGHK